MKQIDLLPKEKRTAVFSECRRYRYTLDIVWNDALPLCQFIGLNPSTADEYQDDPTVRRCKDFAARFGCGGLVMTNLFAWRDTDPRGMKRVEQPIGERIQRSGNMSNGLLECPRCNSAFRGFEGINKPSVRCGDCGFQTDNAMTISGAAYLWNTTERNDSHLVHTAQRCAVVIAAWGNHGEHLGRCYAVAKLLEGKLSCLRVTGAGHPEHPLYLPKTLTPIPFKYKPVVG